jgi:integrin beta 3
VHYQGALVFHEGSTWCARAVTAEEPPHHDWAPVAMAGRDGYVGEARGLFDPAASYRGLDRVAFNGSEWVARQDNPGPLPGDGWMLAAKVGAKGERGDRGPRGEPGEPGISLANAKLVEWAITDGKASIDLLPLFDKFREEAGL